MHVLHRPVETAAQCSLWGALRRKSLPRPSSRHVIDAEPVTNGPLLPLKTLVHDAANVCYPDQSEDLLAVQSRAISLP
jgi:hypothetical protein